MNDRTLRCGDVDLLSLLEGDGRAADNLLAIAHLDGCVQCQRRLETLAAEDDWWRDCQTHLPSTELGSDQSPYAINVITPPRAEVAVVQDAFTAMLAPPSHPELLGRIGRYEVEKLLGRGGMGIVFKAHDAELNRPVAIKVLAPHLACNGSARQRFGREARAAASVVHEHVVGIHDVEAAANPPYLVMQYVPGESLQSYVERHGPLESSDLIRIAHQIAAGLAAAHEQGLIHRDIKPGNIMLENGLGRVVITDFGLARAADDASLTHSGIVAGTPHFMSPEQARGEPADARCDLFSLGAVMYFMATGHPPFRAEQAMAVLHRICHDRHRPLTHVNPHTSRELARVVDRLLEKKAGRRFASAREVQSVIAHLLGDTQLPSGWLHRRSGNWRRVVIGAMGLALVAAAMMWTTRRPPSVHGHNPTTEVAGDRAATSDASTAAAAGGDADLQLPNFARETAAIRRSLERLERRPFPEASAIQLHQDAWTKSLSSAVEHLKDLEASWSIADDMPLSRDSSKGE
jgi:serine/threonine protein kinase